LVINVNNEKNNIFYGADAIGATLEGCLSEHYESIYLISRGDNAKVIISKV